MLRKPVVVKAARAAMRNTSKKKEIRKITVTIAYNIHKYRLDVNNNIVNRRQEDPFRNFRVDGKPVSP